MRIAFVNDTFLRGRGADTAMFEIARELGKKHEVDIISFDSDFKEENFKIKKIPGKKLVTGTWRDFFFFDKLNSIRKATRGYDIVNLHHFLLNLGLWGKNLFVTYNGSPLFGERKSKFRAFMRNWAVNTNKFLLGAVPKIITISNSAKRELTKFGIADKKIEVIYEGVSEDFRPKNLDKNYMLFVGRHEPHKKIDEIIKVSKELDFPLVLAGDGPLTRDLKKLAKRLNAKVKFLGRVSRKKLIKLYQECSFFVSASRWEGFGLIFLEAASCGKPSVAYDCCSMPEIIKRGKTGFLAKNEKDFKDSADELIKKTKLRRKMGKNALLFSKKFTWRRSAEEYEKLFLKSLK